MRNGFQNKQNSLHSYVTDFFTSAFKHGFLRKGVGGKVKRGRNVFHSSGASTCCHSVSPSCLSFLHGMFLPPSAHSVMHCSWSRLCSSIHITLWKVPEDFWIKIALSHLRCLKTSLEPLTSTDGPSFICSLLYTPGHWNILLFLLLLLWPRSHPLLQGIFFLLVSKV